MNTPPVRLRVALLADMLEEGWTSMDVVAEGLMRALPAQAGPPVSVRLVRPALVPLLGVLRRGAPPSTRDRVINRFWIYRRALRGLAQQCDVFHIVDHSYAHLALCLPPGRTVVTCHDVDTFRGVQVAGRRETGLPRFLTGRLARGLRRAAAIACVSRSTARELLEAGLARPGQVRVVPNGLDPHEFTADDEREALRLLESAAGSELILHVGSTVARKRLDIVLETLAALARRRPRVCLVRVGGPLTPDQRAHAARLGIAGRIVELPFLSRGVLQAVYHHARVLLLPSDREGFGLPLLESLQAGVPAVVRDLPVLREVGGEAPVFVRGDDSASWAPAVATVLELRETGAASQRRRAGMQHASQFTWERHAAALAETYASIAHAGSSAEAVLPAAAPDMAGGG